MRGYAEFLEHCEHEGVWPDRDAWKSYVRNQEPEREATDAQKRALLRKMGFTFDDEKETPDESA